MLSMIFLDSVSVLKSEGFVDVGIAGMISERYLHFVVDLDGELMLGEVELIFLSLI